MSNALKVGVYTFLFTSISVWLYGGPLLSGGNLVLKYGVAFGGTLGGVYLANAIYRSWNQSKNSGRARVSLAALASVIGCVLLIIVSRMYFRGRSSYDDTEIATYFLGLFVLTCLGSCLTFYGGKARNII